MANINWNQLFTNLLRSDSPYYWGNWTLDPLIQPGMIVFITPDTGAITSSGVMVPGCSTQVINTPCPDKWDIKSDNVKTTSVNVNLSGTGTGDDGSTVKAGLQINWYCEKSQSVVSEFAQTSKSTIANSTSVLSDQIPWLLAEAIKAEWGTQASGIEQGFCVVTDVIYASGGVNAGANEDKSTFSISGSASDVNEMTGNSVSGRGSYVSTTETDSFDSHLWPNTPGAPSATDIPIAFQVTSFDGTTILPGWTQGFTSYVLNFDNKHGGTYIAHGVLTYEQNGVSNSQKISAIGGGTGSISIPPNAQNLHLVVSFDKSDRTFKFSWPTPNVQWAPTGIRTIDIKGVWPSKPHANDREV